ncbi:MAG: YcxB family protein [Clostridia bacterium]|nr:YcxB family protein [Clostridia bacterium]
MDYYPNAQETAVDQEVRESEPLFENTHIRDKRFFQEFYKRALLTPLHIVIYILIGLAFLSGVFAYIFEQRLLWASLIAPICYYAIVIAVYFSNVRIWSKRQTELSPDQPIVYTTQFFEDHMIVKISSGASHEVNYAVAPKLAATKNYVFLITKARQSFPIKKDGFTKGTYEDFCDFLRAKGYKVKK